VLQNTGSALYFFPDSYITVRKLAFHFGIALVQVGICSYWSILQKRHWLHALAQHLEIEIGRKRAEEGTLAKSQFLANMSHEIRTPMNAVIGMTEIVLDSDLTAEQRECLGDGRDSAHSLLAVINDVLDISKIEAGRVEFERVVFSLRNTLAGTMKLMALRAHEKGLELMCFVSPEIPDALVGDPVRLRQLILNLVGNAIKFTDSGEIAVEVGAGERDPMNQDSAEERSCHLHFSVRDTGIGISPEMRSAIFDAFTQEESSTTRRYGGTGLGLTTSSSLVEMMGGRFWVDLEPGRGSTFHFTMRFEAAESAAMPAFSIDPKILQDLPVLAVHDNATHRLILHRMLERWGMRATVSEGGRAALLAFDQARQARRPFALVIDGEMPEMNGISVAARMRAAGEPRIILLTSTHWPTNEVEGKALGIDAHVNKPIQELALLKALVRVMAGAPVLSSN
jgi:two-component system sensor histidine kinase/response regulator